MRPGIYIIHHIAGGPEMLRRTDGLETACAGFVPQMAPIDNSEPPIGVRDNRIPGLISVANPRLAGVLGQTEPTLFKSSNQDSQRQEASLECKPQCPHQCH
jgi:hypothetical protein